jgi:LemA protein
LAAAAGARLPEQESLPSDATLEQAAETNDAQRSSSRPLLALAESYPDLKADEVFRDLATRMVDLENQVAYARAFYNDAVTVLRDRRGAFPGNLLARYVTTPSWALFDADDSETFVPSMTPLLDAPSR